MNWDIKFVRDFMLVFGPVSSIFDILTFAVLLVVFRASEPLFHTGWFVESLATQALVLFVIRTMGNPFRSRPSRWLTITTLSVVVVGAVLPATPLAALLGFTRLPPSYFSVERPPAMASSVGIQSVLMTGASMVCSALILPVQRTISGTRTPP